MTILRMSANPPLWRTGLGVGGGATPICAKNKPTAPYRAHFMGSAFVNALPYYLTAVASTRAGYALDAYLYICYKCICIILQM